MSRVARTNSNPVVFRDQDGRRPSGTVFAASWGTICPHRQKRIAPSEKRRWGALFVCRDREACVARRKGGRS